MNLLRAYRRARKAFRTFNRLAKEARIFALVRPIKLLRNRKLRKAQEELAEEGILDVRPKFYTDAEVDAEVKEFLLRKAVGGLKSSTVGVASVGTAIGSWFLANPEIWDSLPEWVKGSAFLIYGACLILARLRTAGK